MGFWQGRNVFLTGHTGFKGSWLSLWLQTLGASLVGYSLPPPTSPNLFELAQAGKGMTSIKGDIRDLNLLKSTLKQYQPEIVIHMAAQSLVRDSYQDPINTYTTNVMGTANILEAVRSIDSVKAILNVTSDKCYENKEISRGYCETDNLGGYDPYSNSKACSELVTQAYYNSYFKEKGIGIATARAGNVIGGGDWAKDRLVPDIINACIKEQNILLRYPNSLRPWQHVLDPLNGYLMLGEQLYRSPGRYSGNWNFGPNEEEVKSVSWITTQIILLWENKPKKWLLDENNYPYESQILTLNSTKAEINLKWKLKWDIMKMLYETIDWYKAYINGEDMPTKTLFQIKKFSQESLIV